MKKLTPCLLSLFAMNAVAGTADKPLSADAELGFLMTSGNTQSTALTGKLKVVHDLTRWRNQYVLQALYKEDRIKVIELEEERREDQVTAEKYFASLQSDYKLDNSHRALFVFGSYEEDKFSGYDYQAAVAVGYSDRLIDQARSRLDVSVGPGVSFTKTEATEADDGSVIPGETEESAILRLALSYQYDFSDTAKFTQTLSSDVALESDKNTRTRSESAITANLNSALALKASITVNHNSEVPAERKNTDTQAAVTLVYSF